MFSVIGKRWKTFREAIGAVSMLSGSPYLRGVGEEGGRRSLSFSLPAPPCTTYYTFSCLAPAQRGVSAANAAVSSGVAQNINMTAWPS